MSISRNIFRNIGAGSWGRISTILVKLVQVPLLLSYLGVEDYGRWLILYSLPSWLTYANQGFGSVAANEISIEVARGNINKANKVYSTSYAFLIGLVLLGILLVVLLIPWIPWKNFLQIDIDRYSEVSMTVIWLAIAMLSSFLGELFNGRFRAAQKAYIPMILSSFQSWLELSFIFIMLNYSQRFDSIALSVLCATILYLIIYQWLSWKAFPEICFSFSRITVIGFKKLFKKGFAFQAFPLGNALLFQGNLLVVQIILGPAAVALFGTARTLVRTVSQGLELISKSIWPEMSYLFGEGNNKAIIRLHRTGVGFSIVIAILGIIFLASIGPFFYELWVGKAIKLPYHLLLIFLIPIPFNALWITSSVVLMASNQHEGLAKRYVLATSMASFGCAIFSYFQGIEGAAISVVISDLILIPYVLKQSILLTGDSVKEFIPGVQEQIKITFSQIISRIKFSKII